jgi:hypothetical protein
MDVRSFSLDIQTAVFTPIIYNPLLKFARVNHDYERGDWLPLFPDEIVLLSQGVGTQKANNYLVLSHVWDWLRANNNDAAWDWLTDYEAMWINNNAEGGEIDITGKVNAEPIIGGGNLIAYDMETDSHVRLVTFNYADTIVGNFFTAPWLFWYPTAVNTSRVVRKIAGGIDVYIPLLSYAESWIQKSKITLLDRQPASWTILDVLGA